MATDILLLWEKSIAREIIALGFFCSNVYCKKNLICRNWKISVWDDFAIASSQSAEDVNSGYEFLGPIEISYIVQLIWIYINLMIILWWSKLRALKSTPYLSILLIVWNLQTIILLPFPKIAWFIIIFQRNYLQTYSR